MHKNDEGEYCDPVTFKVFTDNTHVVAIKTSGNVFAWDTVERLNIKAKLWRDLVTDDEFTRADIITLQDPHNLSARDMGSFKYIQENTSTLTPAQEAERAHPVNNINTTAMGSSAKILAAKQAVAKSRAAAAEAEAKKSTTVSRNAPLNRTNAANANKVAVPYNAARHTSGKAAASLTSTALTPHTTAERALLSDEDYMLRPKRIKIKGYARIATNLGNINIELHTDFAPKAVYNFVKLAQKGYYNNVVFHRSIKNFMIQGGDPTGTGRGGTSYWGKDFADEHETPLLHDARGVISMANKGKNTNSSQFFILYRPASHLDRKHTIFGKVVGGLDVLDKMEDTPVGEGDRPKRDIVIKEVVVFVDPFDEWKKQRAATEREEEEEKERQRVGTEEDRVTWTGKRVRGDGKVEGVEEGVKVGKYLKEKTAASDEVVEEVPIQEEEFQYEEPVKKKVKKGGFGNFDAW